MNVNGVSFVQENISVSRKGTIRGLHFQKRKPQGKLMIVLKGSVVDVVVDIRKGSSSFGKKHIFELNEKTKNMLWVPPGYAHGFQALTDETIFMYRVTREYCPEDQHSIDPFDSELSIPWKDISTTMSEKDTNSMAFREYRDSLL